HPPSCRGRLWLPACIPAGTPAGLRLKPSGAELFASQLPYSRGPLPRTGPGRSGRGLRDVSCRSYSVITLTWANIPARRPAGPVCRAVAWLAAQAETLDERAVPGDVGVAQI